MLKARDFVELKEMASLVMDKKSSDKFVKDCKEASQDKLILSEWEADKMANLVRETSLELAEKDGFKDGFDSGILETIKSMLREKIDYNVISKVTNKSIDEIKEIEQSLQD